ncbi:uncharacterized protein PV09_07810, partial [Verruconis gallopava]
MDRLSTINLPVLVLAHSVFLSFLGLRMIFRSPPKPDRESEISAMSGVTTLAIGIAYMATSYMPIEQNQFLHASMPVRIVLALLAGLRLLSVKNMTPGRPKRNAVRVFVRRRWRPDLWVAAGEFQWQCARVVSFRLRVVLKTRTKRGSLDEMGELG